MLSERYGRNVTVERASIDEVYVDVTKEASLLLDKMDLTDFDRSVQELLSQTTTLIAGEDKKEMAMHKSLIRNGHSGQHVDSKAYTSSTGTSSAGNGDDDSSKRIETGTDPTQTQDPKDLILNQDNLTGFDWFYRPSHTWTPADRLLVCG